MSEATSAEWVRAFAPATVANVTCGFDIFGFALEGPGDEVAARACDEPGIRLVEVSGDDGVLPREAHLNTAGVAAQCVLDEARASAAAAGAPLPVGVELKLTKGLPLASGLGSSAASAAAAAVAVNALLTRGLEMDALLRCVTEGERVAAGVAHADNAAACLYGGFVLVRGEVDEVRVDVLPVKGEMVCAMIHPHLEISTRSARAAIPREIAVEDAVIQSGNTAAMVAGLLQGDSQLVASAMVDMIAEPVRTERVPGYAVIREAALKAGALGCGLSGSGPSMFAFCPSESVASSVAEAMERTCRYGGTAADAWTSRIGASGARVEGAEAEH